MDGGALMNQSIHHIDALRWFMGPVSVSAYSATLAHQMEAEDVGVAAGLPAARWRRWKALRDPAAEPGRGPCRSLASTDRYRSAGRR